MTSRQMFSDEEWTCLVQVPFEVAYGVAKVGDSGIFGSFKELLAGVKLLMKGATSYPDNELLRSIVADGEADAEKPANADGNENENDEFDADGLVEHCRRVNLLLQRATEQEAIEIRQWILDIAQEMSNAAKEDGVRVSPPETALISRLREALTQ